MKVSEKYRIIEPLGQRGRKFGDNYVGERKSDGMKVVLKTIRRSNTTKLAEERLSNEARFSFDFEGLPEILDLFQGDNEMILVKRYQLGIPLNEHWKTIKRRDRIKFLIKLTAGIIPIFEKLQQESIVHADIKPGNILVQQAPDGELKVELIDFGLAVDQNKPEERKLVFPLGYAAPELLLNQLMIVDQRTDFFAFGVTIWVLYAGKIPLTHPNPSIFTNLQLTHPLVQHSSIPNGLFRLIEKMTVKHQFATAPNKMNSADVKDKLKEAMDSRINSIHEIHEELVKISQRGFLPKNIFSKS